MMKQEFRYTKKEQLAGIGWLVVFILIAGLGVVIPFVVKKHTPSDNYAIITWLVICFAGILYSIHLWMRRHSFIITVGTDGIKISRFDTTQRVSWSEVKSYTYQCGYPYWFLSLYLINGKRINVYGELKDFNDLVMILKEKFKYDTKEFQYTIRKKIGIFVALFCISSASIMIIGSMIYWLYRRVPIFDFFGFILLSLFLFGGCLLKYLLISQIKISVGDEGLTMKPWIGKSIFISWVEIKANAEIKLVTHQATIVAWIPKVIIRVKNKSISFCEDLDNVDELIGIIEEKASVKINL